MATRKPAFPTGQVIRIAITVVLLVAVVIMKQRCGKAAVELFKALDTRADGGAPRDFGAKPLTPLDAAH